MLVSCLFKLVSKLFKLIRVATSARDSILAALSSPAADINLLNQPLPMHLLSPASPALFSYKPVIARPPAR